MSRQPEYVHPALRPLVNAVAASPQPLPYRELLERLAGHPDAATYRIGSDLPALSAQDLAAFARHYPGAFLEAICEYDPATGKAVIDHMADASHPEHTCLALVGMVMVETLRHYALPLIVRDVQAQVERNRESDELERLAW